MRLRGTNGKRAWGGTAIAVCIGVLLFVALEHGWVRLLLNIFYPVTAGAALAYLIDPVARFLERRVFAKVRSERRKRIYSVVLALLTVVLCIVLLLFFLIPQLIDSVNYFLTNLQSYLTSFRAWLDDLAVQISEGGVIRMDEESVTELFGTVDTTVQGLFSFILDNTGAIAGSTLDFGRGIVNFSFDLAIRLMNGGLAVILSIYFLFGKKGILRNGDRIAKAALTTEQYTAFTHFMHRCNAILIRYILCDLLDGLIVAIANGIFMTIMGMPYVVLVSVVVGVTNLAPTFGPIVGGGIGAFFLLLINPWYALWFLIFTVVLQTVDGYIIKPKLFGDQLGISPVLVLVFIIVSGRLIGIYGVLLSIPLAAIIDFVYRDYLLDWLERRKAARRKKQSESAAGNDSGTDS